MSTFVPYFTRPTEAKPSGTFQPSAQMAASAPNAPAAARFTSSGGAEQGAGSVLSDKAATLLQSSCSHPPSPFAQPVVTLQKNGEKIVRITIDCTCGQRIELDCQY